MKSLHFLYHELRPLPSSYSYVTTCADFEQHCSLFARLQQQTERGFLRPEITFDDGHRSNYEFALPILERHNLRARFFITAGWTGQRAGYMDANEVRALHAGGQQIGAHGWSHALLTHCTDRELDRELAGARQKLEDELGASVTTMSLPGGRANARVLEACWKAGYTTVFTSVPRAKEDTPTQRSTIGRLNMRSGVGSAWLERVLQPESGVLAKLERQDRIKTATKTVMGDRLYAKLWSLLNHQEPDADAAGMPAE
jgi:hypothetical protein